MALFLKDIPSVNLKPTLKDYLPELGTNDMKTVEDIHYVVNLVRASLYTPRGTIFYGRDLGTTIMRYLFEPLDETNIAHVLSVVEQEIVSSMGLDVTQVRVRALIPDVRTKSIMVECEIQYGERWYTIREQIRVEEGIL